MNRALANLAKNSRLIRTLYRQRKHLRLYRDLRGSVIDIACCEPAAAEETLRAAILPDSPSLSIYFNVSRDGDGISLRPLQNAKERQRMLATAYIEMGNMGGWSMCDLGGSNGYYSFRAAPFGFGRIDVVDPRVEHRTEFEFLHDIMGAPEGVRFILGTVEDAEPRYDVMLVQGLLYHLYDHRAFLQRIRQMTRRYLILETELSAAGPFQNMTQIENTADLRMGVEGIALYPGIGTVIALLQSTGFGNLRQIQSPLGRRSPHGYALGRRAMFLCEPT